MLRQALSLLLAGLVLNVQLMAAGPFDAFVQSYQVATQSPVIPRGTPMEGGLRYSQIAGTYGVTLSGVNTDHESTTGTMLLSVASRGLSVGKVILFDQGLIYIGSASGVMQYAASALKDPAVFGASARSSTSVPAGKGTGTLVCQMAHYAVRVQSDGSSGSPATFLDGMMNGILSVRMEPSFHWATVLVEGTGSLWRYETRLSNVVNTQISRTGDNQVDSPGSNPSTFTTTITIPGSEPGDLSNLVQGGKIPDAGNSDWQSTNGFESPNLINMDQKQAYLTLALDGELQSETTTAISAFRTPSDATSWGVGYGEAGDSPTQNSGTSNGSAVQNLLNNFNPFQNAPAPSSGSTIFGRTF